MARPKPKKKGTKGTIRKELVLANNDVICGRGTGVNFWPGSTYFRFVCWNLQPTYKKAPRTLKADFAKHVMAEITSLNPPGRFVELVPKTEVEFGRCYEVPRAQALEKCLQSLREKKLHCPKDYVEQAASKRKHIVELAKKLAKRSVDYRKNQRKAKADGDDGDSQSESEESESGIVPALPELPSPDVRKEVSTSKTSSKATANTKAPPSASKPNVVTTPKPWIIHKNVVTSNTTNGASFLYHQRPPTAATPSPSPFPGMSPSPAASPFPCPVNLPHKSPIEASKSTMIVTEQNEVARVSCEDAVGDDDDEEEEEKSQNTVDEHSQHKKVLPTQPVRKKQKRSHNPVAASKTANADKSELQKSEHTSIRPFFYAGPHSAAYSLWQGSGASFYMNRTRESTSTSKSSSLANIDYPATIPDLYCFAHNVASSPSGST